jgi:hypothetical protein
VLPSSIEKLDEFSLYSNNLEEIYCKAQIPPVLNFFCLWEVSDDATEVLMNKFYSLLAKGKSKREAFDAAMEAVKKEYESLEYYTAFIMLD